MAGKLNNLWCVTGLPGAGKTTLAGKLVETGDFESVERDSYFDNFNNKFGYTKFADLLDVASTFNTTEAVESVFKEYIDSMQSELHFYISWIESLGSYIPDQYLTFYRQLRKLSCLQFLDVLTSPSYTTLLADLIGFFAICRCTTDAANQAKENMDKQLLLDNPELVCNEPRDVTRIHLLNNGIAPRLLILNSTRAHILRVTQDPERRRSGMHGRCDPENVLNHDAYDPKEDWERVLVVNGPLVPKVIREVIHGKLLRGVGQDVIGMIKMFREG